MLFAALRHVIRLEISLPPLLIPIITIWLFSIIVITNAGYCFDPHLPQNFAVGFSGFPQLLQDEDVCLVSAGLRVGL